MIFVFEIRPIIVIRLHVAIIDAAPATACCPGHYPMPVAAGGRHYFMPVVAVRGGGKGAVEPPSEC